MVADALGAAVEGWGHEEIRELAVSQGWTDGLLSGYILAVHMGTYVAGHEPATYLPAIAVRSGSYVPTGPPTTAAVADQCARKGCYTDDSNSALALASHLAEEAGLSAAGVAMKYSDFFFKGAHVRGYPDTAKAVMHLVRDGVPADETGLPPHFPFPGGSFANGGAMRISPLAIAFKGVAPHVLRAVVEVAIQASHRHPEAVDGAAVQARAVQWLLFCDSAVDVPVFLASLVAICDTDAMRAVIADMGTRLQTPSLPLGTAADIAQLQALLRPIRRSGSGFDFQIAAVHMLPCALWVFLRYGIHHPFEAVQRAIAIGGDTDTTASLVGAMCGALHGVDWLPSALLEELENGERGRDYAIDLADRLAALDLGAGHVRA